MYRARLEDSLPRLRDAMAEAAGRAGRDPAEVRLVAVTKAHPLEALTAAIDAGLQDLGENRVEELEWKRAELPDAAVRWHMVGHVQSRKAARVVPVADLIHSVDSVKLARRLAAAAQARTAPASILVQVNTSGEATKSGFDPHEALDAIHEMLELEGIEVAGLMTMAPFHAEEAVLRSAFQGLRETLHRAQRLSDRVGGELSMGMTNDFGIAIEEGSTIVRVGTALFGKRPA